VYLVGLHIHYKMIHGPYNIKLTTAQQAKIKYALKYIDMELYKCIAEIWFNTVAAGSIEQYLYYHIPVRSYSFKRRSCRWTYEVRNTVELINIVNKLNHIRTLCICLDYIYTLKSVTFFCFCLLTYGVLFNLPSTNSKPFLSLHRP
jgi:hypothetical protein